jgi:MFS family permease
MIWLGVLQGLVNAFDIPARQAFVVEMVTDRADLSNAIALNSSLVNGARLIGPSIAGILIALVGEMWCFLIDGFSYLGVLIALGVMRVPRPSAVVGSGKVWHGLTEGLRYAFGSIVMRGLIVQIAVASFFGISYTTLMPLFADHLRKGAADVLGFLMAASGVGAMSGALYLASRSSQRGLGRVIAISSALLGLGLMGFAYSSSLPLSMFLMLFAGAGLMVQTAGANTLLQTMVEERMRGRVMALYTMAFVGMAPFGSLFAGTVAHFLGASHTLFLEGTCCVLAAVRFARDLPRLRTSLAS